jgi:RES domain-containing protein
VGHVLRHVIGSRDPMNPNLRGARWNPADVPTLYASFERDTAIAEGAHLIAVQGLPMSVERNVYTVAIELENVLDLRDDALLASLGLPPEAREDDDHRACQLVGGAAEWLGHDAILVPSARDAGTNLAIYVAQLNPGARLEVVASETL